MTHWAYDYTLSLFDNLSIPTTTKVEYIANNGRLYLRQFSSSHVEEWWAGGAFVETTPISTPEPATMLLLGTGLVSVAGAAGRKKEESSLIGFLKNICERRGHYWPRFFISKL